MAPILGIIANVCSWICVTAWKIETIKPTTNAPISIGAARREAIRIASIIIETTKASVIVNIFVKVKDDYKATKLFIIDPRIKCHPSTRTNSISLNGNEIITGGIIIIPIAIRIEATTMSITRNGTYSKNPI